MLVMFDLPSYGKWQDHWVDCIDYSEGDDDIDIVFQKPGEISINYVSPDEYGF